MAVGDKALSADFNGDGVGDVAIRRDNEYGLWWLMHFMAMAPDVNLAFGISDNDYLLAGDMNNDGQADVVLYDRGNWLCSFTPSTTEYKTPDFANQDFADLRTAIFSEHSSTFFNCSSESPVVQRTTGRLFFTQ